MRYLILSILFHAAASILLKFGALSIEYFSILEVATNGFYLLSILFLFLKAIVWQLSLKTYNLNYAYLFTSAYYPIILFVSYLVFKESITFGNIVGTVLIVIGIIYLMKRRSHA